MKLFVFDVSGTLLNMQGQLYPEVRSLLEDVKASGHKLALATNLSRTGVDAFLRRFELHDLVDAHACATESGYKPEPGMLEDILLEMQMPKESTVMIGDSPMDIYMAKNAGVESIAVSWEAPLHAELLQAQPTHAVESFEDLRKTLEI